MFVVHALGVARCVVRVGWCPPLRIQRHGGGQVLGSGEQPLLRSFFFAHFDSFFFHHFFFPVPFVTTISTLNAPVPSQASTVSPLCTGLCCRTCVLSVMYVVTDRRTKAFSNAPPVLSRILVPSRMDFSTSAAFASLGEEGSVCACVCPRMSHTCGVFCRLVLVDRRAPDNMDALSSSAHSNQTKENPHRIKELYNCRSRC